MQKYSQRHGELGGNNGAAYSGLFLQLFIVNSSRYTNLQLRIVNWHFPPYFSLEQTFTCQQGPVPLFRTSAEFCTGPGCSKLG